MIILIIIALLLAYPVGLLLAWLARDELVSGRRWFKLIIIVAMIIGLWLSFQGKKVMAFSSFFIVIATVVSYWKSFDAKWTIKRI